MLQEARGAALIQKLHAGDPQSMAGDLALRMATQAGAQALGFPLSGVVAPGCSADLILIDCSYPGLRPRLDLVANVLYSAQEASVSDLMVAGRWLMRQRKLLTLDEERILEESERRSERLVRGARPAIFHYSV
jgi:5-methylthioadenosine/S-adenosylhomocysteine deaminase